MNKSFVRLKEEQEEMKGEFLYMKFFTNKILDQNMWIDRIFFRTELVIILRGF